MVMTTSICRGLILISCFMIIACQGREHYNCEKVVRVFLFPGQPDCSLFFVDENDALWYEPINSSKLIDAYPLTDSMLVTISILELLDQVPICLGDKKVDVQCLNIDP